MIGDLPPEIHTALPGPQSRSLVDVLARHECPAITARRARRAATLGTADDDPIVWREARGANVIDADGNRLVDLTSGFGVALAGHRHPTIVQAVEVQAEFLETLRGLLFARQVGALRGFSGLPFILKIAAAWLK